MSKDNKGNTVSTVPNSNNISMYVFNGIEEDCTYKKKLKKGLSVGCIGR